MGMLEPFSKLSEEPHEDHDLLNPVHIHNDLKIMVWWLYNV